MQTTPNLGLKMPAQEDFYNIEDHNANSRIIDNKYKELSDLISSIKGELLDATYPVGSIYMSVNDVDPAVLFGGTWEKLPAGRCLIGAGYYKALNPSNGDSDTTYTLGQSGGLRAIRLTTSNIPAHTHSASIGSAGAHMHEVQICSKLDSDEPQTVIKRNVATYGYTASHTQYCVGQSTSAGSGSKYYIPYTTNEQNHKHNITIQTTGYGTAFTSMSSFLVVNMWKRTA